MNISLFSNLFLFYRSKKDDRFKIDYRKVKSFLYPTLEILKILIVKENILSC